MVISPVPTLGEISQCQSSIAAAIGAAVKPNLDWSCVPESNDKMYHYYDIACTTHTV